jgi:hypothetical protein
MLKKRDVLIAAVLFSILSLFFSSVSYAEFDMTALSSHGSMDLRFDRVAPNDFKESLEMTFTVTSDIGKQYRVSQEVIKPLATMEGREISENQFKMYPLMNSNSHGILIYRQETPVAQFDDIIYTSNVSGSGDSFTLVYTLEPGDEQVPGLYYGTLAYILAPIDSREAQVVVTVNVFAELASGHAAVVEVETSSGSSQLVLSTKSRGRDDDLFQKDYPQIAVKVHGPIGAPYRIYQKLEGGIAKSVAGDELDLSKVLFVIEDGEEGIITKDGSLKNASNKQLLYASDNHGSADEFVITYKPGDDLRLFKAGVYKSRLSFILEVDTARGMETAPFLSVDFDVDVETLFDMRVYSNGKEGLSLEFGEVSYKTGTKVSEVEIYIESNLEKPYQVVQKVASSMVNKKGDTIEEGDFTVFVKEFDTREPPSFYIKAPVAVKEGESVIFASGPSGKSARFKTEYSLTMKRDVRSGDYSASLGYSLLMK